MKILNFTAVDVLPALLNKTKTQTIRPAWDNRIIKEVTKQVKEALEPDWELKGKVQHEKPPRFKVADKVRILWNQRSKYKDYTYCKKCDRIEVFGKYHELARVCPICLSIGKYFNKHLQQIKIRKT